MGTLKLISEEIQDVEYITEQKEGGKKKDDDIVDADFEVVDEEEKEAK